MHRSDSARDASLATVTHARLRAAQGDAATAVELLEAILARNPEAPGARPLLDRLSERGGREARIERLGAWLERIRRGR